MLTEEEFTNLALMGGYDGPLPEPKKIVNNGRNLYRKTIVFTIFAQGL